MKRLFKIKWLLLLSLILSLGCSDDEDVQIRNSAVTNLSAESGIESVTLSWDLPSGSINSFIISYAPNGDSLIIQDETLNQITINGLEGSTEYTFSVWWLDGDFNPSEIASINSIPEIRPPGTFVGDLVFGNQSELDNFELDGQAALVNIEGNLIIQSDGSDNIFDLTVLQNLTLITGNLQIIGNPILSNLSHLSSLTTVEGGEITIQDNRNLVNFCGLGGLTGSITESISNNGFNPSLANILAGNCKTQDLVYEGFPRFNTQAEVDALPDGITHFPGELVIGLDASTNDITDLSKFSRLRRIEGRLIIQRTPQITDLTGFTALEFVGNTPSDELVIRQMDGLLSLDGLQALIQVGRRVGIRENPNLRSLEGLNNLRQIGENNIAIGVCGGTAASGNPLITDYCALETLIETIGIPALELGGSCINSFSTFNPSFQDILNGNCSN